MEQENRPCFRWSPETIFKLMQIKSGVWKPSGWWKYLGTETKNRNGYRRVAGRLSTADQCIESRAFRFRFDWSLSPASGEQKAIAGKWLQTLNLEYLAENDFLKLSYGQQRMILIARAMVKSPSLLILDEPCPGLDPHNRNQILKVMTWSAAEHRPKFCIWPIHRRSSSLPDYNWGF